MEIDEKFYESEWREGFLVESKMKRFWAAEIEVLEEIRRICIKHDIKFCADWGTLLGTVRHKGFIPWDDDLDICMLRNDLNRFIEIAPKELKAPFELRNIQIDVDHDQVISRVINGRHMNFDKEHLEKFHFCPFSAGIDLFPIDYLPRDTRRRKEQDEIFRVLMTTASSLSPEPPYNDDDYDVVNKLEEMTGFSVDWNNRLYHEIKRMIDNVCAKYESKDADEVCAFMRFYWDKEYHLPKEWYSEIIELPFEYTTVPVPIGYKQILQKKYGDDYMIPINKGGGHNYPVYEEQEVALKEIMEQEFNVKMTLADIQKIIDLKVLENKC